VLDCVFIVIGLAAAAWGIVTALRASRPASLGGAIVAAVGLALALIGATRLLVRIPPP
jgi:hypothetical protein